MPAHSRTRMRARPRTPFILEPADRTGIPIAEAAAQLGLSVDAVRKRIRRGTLTAYKVDAEWRVVLPDRPGRGQDVVPNAVQDAGQDNVQDASTQELLAALRDEVTFLRRELEARAGELETRAEELRRKDEIIAALVQRFPGEHSARVAPAIMVGRESWFRRVLRALIDTP